MRSQFKYINILLSACLIVFLMTGCNKDETTDPPAPPVSPPAWKTMAGTDTSVLFNAVAIAATGKAWIIGDSGRILSSTDDGNTWKKKIYGDYSFYGIDFDGNVTPWICGTNGILLHTSDGENWDSVPSGTASDLYSIQFNHNLEAWAVGAPKTTSDAVMLHSADGGLTWQHIATNTNGTLTSVWANDTNVWACGTGGKILHSTNKGLSWNTYQMDSTIHFKKILFTDTNNGWVAGSKGAFFKTTDGGQTWNAVALNTLSDLYSIYFLNEQEAWVSGSQGKLYHSSNGGQTWTLQNTQTEGFLLGVAFNKNNIGFAVGATKTNKGLAIRYK
jgi:photosystem II stability/assembly factor-like uncharacterized protein